jgi:hypothetical protein
MNHLTINQRHIVGTFMQATSQEIEHGRTWYGQAYDVSLTVLVFEYQLNTETVAAVIAALSPNNKWERNCKDAENVIAAFMLGADTDALKVKVCTYGKNLAKAVAILQATHCDYESILSGPKVTEFFPFYLRCR